MARRGCREQGRESFWRGKIGEQAGSGLTVSEFCRREGFSPNSFYRWRRVLLEGDGGLDSNAGESKPTGSDPGVPFVPVSVRASAEFPSRPVPSEAFPVEAVLSSGLVLRVRPGFDSDTLVRLLGLLGSSTC
jgi:transposase-like protein